MKNILELKVKNEDYLLQYLLKNITNKRIEVTAYFMGLYKKN